MLFIKCIIHRFFFTFISILMFITAWPGDRRTSRNNRRQIEEAYIESRRRRFRIDSKVHCEGARPLCGLLSRRGLYPIMFAYDPCMSARCRCHTDPINAQCQYASSPRNRTYCYAELAVSFLTVAVTVASTNYVYPQRMARLSIPGWLIKYQDGIPANGHPSQY